MRTGTMVAGIVAACLMVAMPAMANDGDVARGQYLINGIMACGNCHSPRGADGSLLPGQELSGGTVFDEAGFKAVASNITPDRETGIGNWTDLQLATAIREGKRPDGSLIGPPMPFEFYRNISDADLHAIVAALRAVKPVAHAVGKSQYSFPLPPAYGPPIMHVADVPRGATPAYGKYLADIGHCLECHTPRVKGQLDLARLGGGGRELPDFRGGVVVSANLTPGNPDGIAHWTNAQIKTAITTGVRPDGRRLVPLMAFYAYKTMNNTDMDALIAYLRTLRSVKN